MSNGAASPGITNQGSDRPLTLISLIVLLVKGYIKSIPKMLIWTIVRAVLSFLIVLVLHTYLVVVKNEGFAADPGNPLYRLMAFPATSADALAFWSITAFLVSSLAGRIWFGGPVKLIKDFAAAPGWLAKSFQKSSKLALPVLLAGIAVALAGAFLTQSRFVLMTAAIGIILSLTSREQGLWFLFLSTIWSDFKRLFLKNKTINHGTIVVLIAGLVLGLLLALVIPFGVVGRVIAIVLCLAGLVFSGRRNLSPKVLFWIGLFLVFQAILMKTAAVYADDGGWMEAGGTFSSWWNSMGRARAIQMGYNPALLAFLASLLGSGTVPKPPPIPGVMDYNVEGWKWLMENGKWVLYQADSAGNKFGTGIPQSIFEADPESFGNMVRIYTQKTCEYGPSVDKINNAMDNLGRGYTDRFTMAGWKNMSVAEKTESMRALSHIIAETAGVDPKSFTFRLFNDPSTGLQGQWDGSSRVLEINVNSYKFDNPLSMIQTICHEMRHAAQSDTKADLGGGKDYRDLMTWNDQNANYQSSSSDFTRYSGQLLERDADAFGRSVSRAIINQVIGNRYGL